jgi:ATP-binding cassette subfamily F protein 3
MVQLDNVSLAFGGQQIFDNLTWFIKETGRTGLVGPNGAGKTTLLRLLSGSVTLDSGNVSFRGGMSLGYLQQEVLEESKPGQSVVEHVLASFEDLAALERSEAAVLRDLERPNLSAERTTRLLTRLDEVHRNMEALEAHTLEYRAESVLSGLGFDASDMTREVESFSGGWRMRMALATLLLQSPDLLLLDEPTNHLDIETIDWLEQYLAAYSGAVILVSHDRYFLDRMVTSIAELSRGRLTTYAGNYEFYLTERALRREQQMASYLNQQREIKQAEQFIRRFKAKATKAKQAQSRVKMLEKLERIEAPIDENAAVRFRFPEGTKPYKVVLELSEFSKTYEVDNGPDVKVFDHARSLTIDRGDRIALAGRNGAGKSTLARILKGIEPFDGELRVGGRVEIGFFAQSQAETLDPSQTVLSAMQQAAYGWDETRIRSLLGAFLFSESDVDKTNNVLSGGERSRLALAITLVTPANLLILDEPTNHLDIRSRNALVHALDQFPGTFVVISHDRHFIDQVARKVWYVADGDIREHYGTYSDMHVHAEPTIAPAASNQGNSSQSSNGQTGRKSKEQKRLEAEARNRLSRERKRLKELIDDPESPDWSTVNNDLLEEAQRLLESRIAKLEQEKSKLEVQLADPEFYADSARSSKVVRMFDEAGAKIRETMTRWEDVASRLERDS